MKLSKSVNFKCLVFVSKFYLWGFSTIFHIVTGQLLMRAIPLYEQHIPQSVSPLLVCIWVTPSLIDCKCPALEHAKTCLLSDVYSNFSWLQICEWEQGSNLLHLEDATLLFPSCFQSYQQFMSLGCSLCTTAILNPLVMDPLGGVTYLISCIPDIYITMHYRSKITVIR